MSKRYLVFPFIILSFVVLFKGLTLFAVIGEKIVTCSRAFSDRCTNPGQCSYNLGHSASGCKITCVTKYTLNGQEERLTMVAECGAWKSNGDGGDTGSNPGHDTGEFDPEGNGTPWVDPFQ